MGGRPETVAVLVAYKTLNLELVDYQGWTAVFYAVAAGHIQMVSSRCVWVVVSWLFHHHDCDTTTTTTTMITGEDLNAGRSQERSER